MNNVFYRGTIIRFEYCFDVPQKDIYIIAEHQDDNFPFQLICISGQKSGTIGAFIKKDVIINQKAVSKQHLLDEIHRNFLNFDDDSFEVMFQS